MQGVLEVKEPGRVRSSHPAKDTARKNRQPIVSPKVQPPKPKRLTDAQAELAGEHWDWAMGLARKKADQYKHYSFSLDFESAAAVGLCEAAMAFEPGRGVAFQTYAYIRVHGAITDMMRGEELRGYGRGRHGEAPQVSSMDSRLTFSHQGTLRNRNLSKHEMMPSGELPTGWELRSIEEVEAITRRLEWTHREVMILLYCYGFPMAKAGRVLGLSESRVSQIHTAAIDFLREALAS